MTAHAEQLCIHVFDKRTELKVIEHLWFVLYRCITDDEIQIVHRCKYIQIGSAFFVDIIRIEHL